MRKQPKPKSHPPLSIIQAVFRCRSNLADVLRVVNDLESSNVANNLNQRQGEIVLLQVPWA